MYVFIGIVMAVFFCVQWWAWREWREYRAEMHRHQIRMQQHLERMQDDGK